MVRMSPSRGADLPELAEEDLHPSPESLVGADGGALGGVRSLIGDEDLVGRGQYDGAEDHHDEELHQRDPTPAHPFTLPGSSVRPHQ